MYLRQLATVATAKRRALCHSVRSVDDELEYCDEYLRGCWWRRRRGSSFRADFRECIRDCAIAVPIRQSVTNYRPVSRTTDKTDLLPADIFPLSVTKFNKKYLI